MEHLELVLHQVGSPGDLGEWQTELTVLKVVPAGSHADLDAAAAHLVDGRDDLGERTGMAEGHRRDERAEADGRGLAGDSGQDRPGVGGRVVIRAREAAVMVRSKQGFEAEPFGQPGNLQLLQVGQALLGLEHEGDAH